ncbi:hypothetical protein [Streptomyces venezuelae]|uniref:hypothetical protein n=1 Tax=Streptomyces venezuelae TaxID=54571 RepID=UPI001680CD67|nr:hypothetical protein [Streptomyces venezuelae]
MGRSTWLTRTLGGGALLCAGVALWRVLFRAGPPLPGPWLAVLGSAAVLCAAGWVGAAVRPVRPPRAVPAEPPPGPPARMPWRAAGRLRVAGLVCCVLFLPMLLVDLGLRPDGAEARRIAVLREAGAIVDEARIEAVHRRNPRTDLTVRVPGLAVSGHESVRVTGAVVDGRPAVGGRVQVLHVPGSPGLGGYVDEAGVLARYAADAPAGWAPRFFPGSELLFFLPVIGLLGTAVLALVVLRPPAGVRALRADARTPGRQVWGVRAEVRVARRTVQPATGRTGRTWLAFTTADGVEFKAGGEPGPVDHDLAAVAAELTGRPGWLCGRAHHGKLSGPQPVCFATDTGDAVWLLLDPSTFRRVLRGRVARVATEHRVRLLRPRAEVRLRSHLPWLAGVFAAWVLLLPVLLTPSGHGRSWLLAGLSAAAFAGALALLFHGRSAGRAAGAGWETVPARARRAPRPRTEPRASVGP